MPNLHLPTMFVWQVKRVKGVSRRVKGTVLLTRFLFLHTKVAKAMQDILTFLLAQSQCTIHMVKRVKRVKAC